MNQSGVQLPDPAHTCDSNVRIIEDHWLALRKEQVGESETWVVSGVSEGKKSVVR